ncbi:hypothetical protein NST63_26940 [Heyndrickxia sp. FSL W8-0496]|uniref:hypothetical protein n=1 Tax=Heyndrickxia TaxID=2837504 RepID=UPI0030F9D62A
MLALTQLFTKKKSVFTHLSIDLPVHHSSYMKYNKQKVGAKVPHKDVEEIFGQRKTYKRMYYMGKLVNFYLLLEVRK